MGRTPTRSMYLDALRTLALFRVVLYHASSMWTLTVFTAMPLMFFIAGSLFASSLERRSGRKVIVDRYRRILFPYWLYVVALVVLWAAIGVIGEVNPLAWISFAMPVLSFGGPKGPPGQPIDMTWIALWYLQMHLILSLVGPWLRSMQQRHGRRFWIAISIFCALTAPIGLGIWTMCWCVGYLQHDGVLDRWLPPRWKWIAAISGTAGAALFFALHSDVESGAGIGAMPLGVFWVTVAIGLQDRLEPLLAGRRVRSFLHWSSSRSLTIYLWHMMLIYATVELAFPGSGSAVGRVVWCLALLPPVILLVGWIEDLAARKSPRLWPRLPAADVSGQSVPNTRSPASPKPGTM